MPSLISLRAVPSSIFITRPSTNTRPSDSVLLRTRTLRHISLPFESNSLATIITPLLIQDHGTAQQHIERARVRRRLKKRSAQRIHNTHEVSAGTLGGLVELGDPLTLGRHLQQALESMRLCASDPLCAEHHPDTTGRGIHGACCHACQFSPETSCERGNRYLDRSILVETFSSAQTCFFK